MFRIRAWHKKRQEMFSCEQMVKDQMTLLPDGRFINVSGAQTNYSIINYDMIPLISSTYLDKNGIEIFQGDILTSEQLDENIGVDVWKREDYGICVVEFSVIDGIKFVGTPYNWNVTDNESTDNLKYLEIIGNIYENGDLLCTPSS